MAVLLKDGAREGLSAHDKDCFAVLFELVDQRDEIAVPAHHGKGVDVGVCKGHLQGIQGQVDVRSVLIASR